MEKLAVFREKQAKNAVKPVFYYHYLKKNTPGVEKNVQQLENEGKFNDFLALMKKDGIIGFPEVFTHF
ncbi:MAG: hypothetical protein MJ092_05975 [Lachnospiraceae bacterium]|nr:hypothetical protein [Lachnospiraceae bacterium]